MPYYSLGIPNITILIGSGFSIHSGFPTTTIINDKLINVTENEFVYNTSQEACFLNGRSYPNNSFEHKLQRRLFISFRNFYIKYVIGGKEKFHYEDFYDYYKHDLHNQRLHFDNFYNQFKIFNNDLFYNDVNPLFYLQDIDFILQGLVGSVIREVKFQKYHITSPYDGGISRFLYLIEFLSKKYMIHIASLNHDCYLERLNYSDAFHGKLEDGFEESGSVFFGDLDLHHLESLNYINLSPSTYKVRLPIFTNKFEGIYRLYKLHGGIDQYWYSDKEGSELVKVKKYIHGYRVFKEVLRDQKITYIENAPDSLPNVLTGSKSKIKKYNTPYFQQLFNRFKNALASSKTLIIIGYGFKDSEINRIICNASTQSLKILVIDRINPTPKKMQNLIYKFYPKGVEDFDLKDLLKHI